MRISERRMGQEAAGVECAGVSLAEGGEVYRPPEAMTGTKECALDFNPPLSVIRPQ